MTASTPHLGPLYPMPPVEYTDAELLVATYELAEDRVESLLPAGLEPGPLPLAAAVVARYPKTTIGPYRENIEFLQVRSGDHVGLYVAFIYVTTDVALAQGREVWGFPKKLADISLSLEDGFVEAALRRGHEILRLVGSVDLESEVSADVLLSFFDMPIINLKRIPSPDGQGSDVDLYTATPMEYIIKEAHQGEAELNMKGSAEDPLHLITPDDSEVVLFYVRGDMTLMPGQELHTGLAGEASEGRKP